MHNLSYNANRARRQGESISALSHAWAIGTLKGLWFGTGEHDEALHAGGTRMRHSS
jgi:hypothetical protein